MMYRSPLILWPKLLNLCFCFAALIGGISLFAACEFKGNHLQSSDFDCDCWLDELNAGDTLYFRVESTGCFHSYQENWKIYWQADSLRVHFTWGLLDDDRLIGPYVQPFPLPAKLAFAELIHSSQSLTSDQTCTDQTLYQVQLRAENLEFVDSDCILTQPYHHLKQAVFDSTSLTEMFLERRALRAQPRPSDADVN